MVLSSQALGLSLAHLNKVTADCQRKLEQENRGGRRKPMVRGDETVGHKEVKW